MLQTQELKFDERGDARLNATRFCTGAINDWILDTKLVEEPVRQIRRRYLAHGDDRIAQNAGAEEIWMLTNDYVGALELFR